MFLFFILFFSCKKEEVNLIDEVEETCDYVVYSALISQYGNNNPTVIVLENSLGNITWTRSSIGLYNGEIDSVFIGGKTWVHSETGFISHVNYNFVRLKTYSVNDTPSDGELFNTPIEIRVYN